MKRKSMFYFTVVLVIHFFFLFIVSNVSAECTEGATTCMMTVLGFESPAKCIDGEWILQDVCGTNYPICNAASGTCSCNSTSCSSLGKICNSAGVCVDENDCDGSIDEDCCTDADSDGYYAQANCGTAVDCNDSGVDINPGVTETCDGIDNNCDGLTDEACPEDYDGDGYTIDQGDCDDYNADIHPGAHEFCNDGIDQDCNGFDCPVGDDSADNGDSSEDTQDKNSSGGGGGGGCFLSSSYTN
jgi:hypothetical protein